MRFTGTLRTWNEDRGFGFIAPAQGGREVFVHISAFARDGSRPTQGEALTYELGRNGEGKPHAIHVRRQAFEARQPRRREVSEGRRASPVRALLLAALVVALGAFGYQRYARRPAAAATQALTSAAPAANALADTAPAFAARCDGRKYCSQMTSCAEATFFLRNCPGTQMDGDHDGVPCERQWCTGPLAR